MHAIRVEGLVKRYGAVEALKGIGFEVPEGTIFGLLGPNGAGKTTAIRVLATILHPDAGVAEVMGRDVTRDAAAVRRAIGLAGQNAAVDPNLTGRENLVMVGKLTHLARPRPRAAELLDAFALTEAADRPVRTYSGGMRRRLDLAAALVHRPSVLLRDEPTTGLDPQSRNDLWEMIRTLVADGTTVLLTTQYMEEADRLAQAIAVVDGGLVIENDTPAALKARLGSTVVEFGLATADGAARAEAILRRAFGEHVGREGTTIHVTANDGARSLIEALRALDAEALEPATVTVREPSLDDVFLALTGAHVRAEVPEKVTRR